MANALAWVSQGTGPTYIYQQDFESAGIPSGWTNAGGCTFHNTSSPLEGTGDLDVAGGAGHYGGYILSPTLTECWFVCLLKLIALPSSGTTRWMVLTDTGFSPVSSMRVDTLGNISCRNGSTAPPNMVTKAVAGTLYYFKEHYKVGTGANSISTWELSTTGSWIGSGGLFTSTSSGNSTTNIGAIQCIYEVDNNARFDHIRLSATDIGSNFSDWV